MADTITVNGTVHNFLAEIAYVFGFNAGPDYLCGIPFGATPFLYKVMCFSDLPLKLGIYAGVFSGLLGLILLIYTIVTKISRGTPGGYATTIVVICFMDQGNPRRLHECGRTAARQNVEGTEKTDVIKKNPL